MSILKCISNKIKENWDETDAKYNPGQKFQGNIVDKKKTRKITQEQLPMLPLVENLINMYENINNHIRVTKVWFHKMKDNGDGFKKFHYNLKNLGGGSNNVSFTVVVILEKLNDANKIATINIS